MLKDDRVRLQHMLDAAREAVSFSVDKSRADLNTDRMDVNLDIVWRTVADDLPPLIASLEALV